MNPQVVVVGSFVQDLTWRCPEFPGAGETVIGAFATGPGGKGSNQAVAAGRAGAPTAFVGAVGRDEFGAAAAKFYRAEGIGARFIVKPRHPTGTAAILVNAAGQNEIIVALGASAQLQPRDIDPALIRAAKVVVCQHEANLRVNAHVFHSARRAGVITILNPAPMRSDFDSAILRLTDVLIPNESEFAALVNRHAGNPGPVGGKPRRSRGRLRESALPGLPPPEMHRFCRSLGVPTVIVTLGPRGCFVSLREGGWRLIAGHAGLKVVDTTGAGDAFVGSFAAGLARFGGEVVGAAQFANAAGALSVTKFGTAPSMPTASAIARFQRERGAQR